jgi:uracil-DNA glycosylase
MRTSDHIRCEGFPCGDVEKGVHLIPSEEIDPEGIRILMISEAPPPDAADYFWAPGDPFYLRTTLQAFRDAGADPGTMRDIIGLGVYITTAVKCAKTQYAINTETIESCSRLLDRELTLFPRISTVMLMGDTAIRSMNYIAKRAGGARVIPAGSTYKIRKERFYYRGARVFPSYLQTGGNYLIEKSKRRMIAEDLREALGITRDT